MKKRLIVCLSLFIASGLAAQVNTFNKHLPYQAFSSGTEMHALDQTTDKGYVLCRGVVDSLSNLLYCDLLKYDKAGNYKWAKRIHQGDAVAGFRNITHSVIKTIEGGLLLSTAVYNALGETEIILVKTDSIGDVEWSAKYPAAGSSTVSVVKQTTDLGYVVCGSTKDTLGNQYAYIFKVDNSGNYSWGKKVVINGEVTGLFNSVTEIAGQGYIAVGYSGNHALIIKTDLNGNLIWDKFFLGANLSSVVTTQDTSVVYTGSMVDSLGIYNRFIILKTDPIGNMLWMKYIIPTHSFYNGSYGSLVQEKSNGDLVFCGYLADPIPSEMLLTTNSNGVVKWCKQYISTWHTFNYLPSSFVLTTDGGFAFSVLGGTHTGPGMTNNYSTILVKTDSLGNMGCDGNSYLMNLVNVAPVFTSNTLISNSGNQLPYLAVLIPLAKDDTTICETIVDSASTASVFENRMNDFGILASPNPFSDELTINYKLQSVTQNVTMEIYDVNGIKKHAVSKNNFNKGDYSLTISTVDFIPGIYFYSMTIDGKRVSGKIIKVY